jgi:polyribonucleotide nucleotidyltransferase
MTQHEVHTVSAEIAGRTLTLETGRFAEQANGAVLVRYGETVLLATVVASDEPREGVDFFPLTVDYEEKMYAAGKIPGSFFKREGRPTETAILLSRLTDRPLRPLFPKGYNNDVQVMITTLSIDMVNDPGPLAIIGASAALAVSDIPFAGPVGAALVGHLDGSLEVNPRVEDMERSRLELVVAGTADAVLMVEAGAWELSEDEMLQAVIDGHTTCKQLAALQNELVAKAGKPKKEFVPPQGDTTIEEQMRAFLGSRLLETIINADKQQRVEATGNLKAEAIAHVVGNAADEQKEAVAKEASRVFESLLKLAVRDMVIDRETRVDGRSLAEIRPISVETSVLPRTHGTGLFTRGQTQVLTVTTLGGPGEEQRLDDLGVITSKRYIHHYNFPPFSTGEARPSRGPRRRDIGHGALAERALYAVLPDEEEFPYTMRLVSEVLSSNGSSSMASVCGSSLSLMDAGVPIKRAVAGVAMGLVTREDGSWKVLTDIQGIEDALGDMDFKVAGTERGVTALQMDIKTTGITYEIMRQAFAQAREGRIFILGEMAKALDKPRSELSPYAPRVITIRIDPEKIGLLIGPGGKTIRSITESTGASIDIEDDGRVFISTPDGESARKAIEMVEGLTREAKIGDVFLGKVVRIMPFGAFVNILPNKDGMVHVSELDTRRVEKVEDVLQIGDEINVMVIDIDPVSHKISLSRRAVLTGESPEDRKAAGAAPRGGGRNGGDRGPRDRGPRDRGPRDRGPRD